MNHDKFKFSGEAFDFNAVNDLRGTRAHLKAQVRYQMLKHLELYGGWDNFPQSAVAKYLSWVGSSFYR
jgi:phospholipid/cholesterol/gamma-HCH transport system substrate-binding protein